MREIPQSVLEARQACADGQMTLDQLVATCDQLYEEQDAETLQFLYSVGAEAAFARGDRESAYELLIREEEILYGLDNALADLWLNLHNQFALLLQTGGTGSILDADALEDKMKNVLQACGKEPFMDYCPLKRVVSRATAGESYQNDAAGYQERKAKKDELDKLEKELSDLEAQLQSEHDHPVMTAAAKTGLYEAYANSYRRALALDAPHRSAEVLCQILYAVAHGYSEAGNAAAVAENCEDILAYTDKKAMPLPEYAKWAARQLFNIYAGEPELMAELLDTHYDYLVKLGFPRDNLDEASAIVAAGLMQPETSWRRLGVLAPRIISKENIKNSAFCNFLYITAMLYKAQSTDTPAQKRETLSLVRDLVKRAEGLLGREHKRFDRLLQEAGE